MSKKQLDTIRWYPIEGPIAAGKTDLVLGLEAAGIPVLQEPVEEWRSGYPDSFLGLYYATPTRWGFTLQILAFITRAKSWDKAMSRGERGPHVMERSVFSDRIFARLLYELGNMTESEYLLYNDLWDFMAEQWDIVEPTRTFYLRTPAATCLERIKKRGRPEEKEIKIEFLLHLERLHDEELLERDDVVVLDGLKTTSELVEDVVRAIGIG